MSAADASPPWDLLARQLAGEATPADEAAVHAWRRAGPENAALWQQLAGVWTETGRVSTAPVFGVADTAQAWQHFETNVLGPPPAPPATPAVPNAPPAVPGAGGVGALAGWGKVAALLVVGAGTGWLLRTALPPATDPPPLAARVEKVVPLVDTAPVRSLATVDLVFEDEPVRSVARRLESAFAGTHVIVADSALAGQRFTGTFRAARPAGVLRVVGVATGAALAQRPDSTWVLGRAGR